MSQKTVEHLIGKLATDEEARIRFRLAGRKALEDLASRADPLTAVELEALSTTDPDALDRFADALDPRLQRVKLPGGDAREGRS